MKTRSRWLLLVLLVLATVIQAAEPVAPPQPLDLPGLHNVFQIGEQLYSGSGPESDAAFQALAKLGIKTVLSVDGATPDVERARRHGLRYVHVPIGYDSVPRGAALQIAQAVRELPQPIYIHCHHGKHRGPAAAAIARLCQDERCQVDDALRIMQQAGTDPRYAGLFRSVREFRRPSEQELQQLAGPLPAAVVAQGVKQQMVAIDHAWSELQQIRAAGWKTPTDHPDLVPQQVSLQLVESFRELHRLPLDKPRDATYREWCAASLQSAEQLDLAVRTSAMTNVLEERYRVVLEQCSRCHTKYRD
ncbi:MAG: hypothetical protein JNM18_17175 [Planctomycetaceae bacterium]|nr:hypothetical protein [Planctomycetaceae bacterium]